MPAIDYLSTMTMRPRRGISTPHVDLLAGNPDIDGLMRSQKAALEAMLSGGNCFVEGSAYSSLIFAFAPYKHGKRGPRPSIVDHAGDLRRSNLMADDDDFDYDYDPLFDVSTQCSCEDPVEYEQPSGEPNELPGDDNPLPNPERRRINAESGAFVRGVSKGHRPSS